MEKAAVTQNEAVLLPVVLEAVQMGYRHVVCSLLGLAPSTLAGSLQAKLVKVMSVDGFRKVLQAATQHMPALVERITELRASARPTALKRQHSGDSSFDL
jgi:hypothetical protein